MVNYIHNRIKTGGKLYQQLPPTVKSLPPRKRYQQVSTLSQYAVNRNARRSANKARKDAYDAALRAYFAARNEAIANGTKLPNMASFEPAKVK